MNKNFLLNGFTSINHLKIDRALFEIQNLIYSKTKLFLENHDPNLSLERKLNLKFKNIPTRDDWSNIMSLINNSTELKNFINSRQIKNAFKLIFKDPEPFAISTFRARFPSQKRVIYDWHQDQGTWFLSQNKDHIDKFPATLWFSINGASKSDSIELIKYSHKYKLFYHNYIKGQGYFKIKNQVNYNKRNLINIHIEPSQYFIFHPLLIHRSAPNINENLRPRYTIDVRYFDYNYNPKYKKDIKFEMIRLAHKYLK